ncbi:MAG: GSCFA domain-containing protein [Paludibacteraceae bacterium]|nr:GSCFA domain-containing protein [Paludibacteraceae bacterium]
MIFSTSVDILPSSWKITYNDQICLLGSCFSDNMARRFQAHYFRHTCNPSGTLYNPISIAHHMQDDCVKKADVICITFGTAWVYEENGVVVDNCQKRPASCFKRRRLTVDEIVETWRPILARYSTKRFIFTVSPIRHVKDGLHENQLSKAILLMAVERLTAGQRNINYFPAYEILLDELRDYRFYADDLKHPSSMAVTYIWERLVAAYMEESTLSAMNDLHQLWLDKQHRPLNPGSPEDIAFQQHIEQEMRALRVRFPWVQ